MRMAEPVRNRSAVATFVERTLNHGARQARGSSERHWSGRTTSHTSGAKLLAIHLPPEKFFLEAGNAGHKLPGP